MKKCVIFFALFMLAVTIAALVDDEDKVDLIEEVTGNSAEIDQLLAEKHRNGFE